MKYIDKFKDKKSGEVRQIRDTTIVANSGAGASEELKTLAVEDKTYFIKSFDEGSVTKSLVPETNQTKNLGSKSKNWKSVFGKEVHASKFRLDTGKVDGTTGEPVYETFAVYQDEQLKIQRGGSSVAQFGKGSFSISDGYHKIIERQKEGEDVRINFANGNQGINLASGQIEFYDAYDDNILMEVNRTGTLSLWDVGGYKIIDMESACGGFNIGASNFDLVHEDKINLIPNFNWNGTFKGVKHVEVQEYDRIKIGGKEHVTPDTQGVNSGTEVIFAYKPANSGEEVVPFAITKDGKAYYNGGELATKKDSGGGSLYMHNYDIWIVGDPAIPSLRLFFNFISTNSESLTVQEIGNMFDGDAFITCGGYITLDGSTHTVWGIETVTYDAGSDKLDITVLYDDHSTNIGIPQDYINASVFKVI